MKVIFIVLSVQLFLLASFLPIKTVAQVPEKINYQAIIRDTANNILTNQVIKFRISVLKDSENGIVVYTETHIDTTNHYGIVNLDIGSGVSGDDFSSINWEYGTFYLQIELDETGGDNYKMMGTSQLLSVPYALYAEKANIDGSETKVNAGTNITVTGNGTSSNPYIINSSSEHYPGEFYGGGVVFWVDHSGQHGLIVSIINLSYGEVWSNITSTQIGSDASSLWNGYGNSIAIVSQAGHTNSAAKLCLDYINTDYGTGIFDDWYLPSTTEIRHLLDHEYEVYKTLETHYYYSTLSNTIYWTSTEWGNNYAYIFDPNIVESGANKSEMHYVRAIRAF